jgi:endo-1,4-beta-xylanase
MSRRVAAAAFLVAALGGGCGGDDGEIELPSGLAAEAPEPNSFAKPLGAAVATGPARNSEAYLRAFVTTFTSATPENAMKWSFVHPERTEFDFGPADRLVELARSTGKRVRGHALVWDRQLPDWVADGDWARDELAGVLRDHVGTVVRHYRGRVAEWDVVNEPFDPDGSWNDGVFHRVLGPRYVDIAFRAARAADPDARLYLNELGAEPPGARARSLLRLARDLAHRGVPIDGVGFQNHTSVLGFPTREELRSRFDAVGALGLDAAITEMDVIVPPERPIPDASARQARAYREAGRACVEAPNCTGLTIWGVTDEFSWLGAERSPLPFDADGAAKPALTGLLEALRR